MKNKKPWYIQFTPLNQQQEADYVLPYLIAMRMLANKKATDDHLATIVGHLRIGVHLPCDPSKINYGRKAIWRLIKQWEQQVEFDESDIELVSIALEEYDRIVRFAPRGLLQQAIKKVM